MSLPKNRGQRTFYDTPFVLEDFFEETDSYFLFRGRGHIWPGSHL